MTALNVISVLNVDRVPPPYSSTTGGSSSGNPNLGTGSDDTRLPVAEKDITTADKAGAAIVTILMACMLVGGAYWMMF